MVRVNAIKRDQLMPHQTPGIPLDLLNLHEWFPPWYYGDLPLIFAVILSQEGIGFNRRQSRKQKKKDSEINS
jgi:hypothetical protein